MSVKEVYLPDIAVLIPLAIIIELSVFVHAGKSFYVTLVETTTMIPVRKSALNKVKLYFSRNLFI